MNKSMNMPERDFERALGAQLKVDGASVRLSRSPWDAVAPQMGNQRSMRPWEYIMDAMNKTRMPFKPQYIYTAGGVLVVAIVAVLLVLFLNTDDDEVGESVPAAISAPAAPAPVTLADGFTVEPGSEEAAIVSLTERFVTGLRTRDIEAVYASCHPDLQAKVSVAQIAAYVESDSTHPSYGQTVYTSAMNVVIQDIRRFRDTATVRNEHFEGESLIGEGVPLVVEKVNGTWYLATERFWCSASG